MIEGQEPPMRGLWSPSRREWRQRLEMPGLSVGHPSHYLVSAQYLRSDDWMGSRPRMRGPYVTTRKRELAEFTITLPLSVFDAMMRKVKEMPEPNRSEWVRDCITTKLAEELVKREKRD